MEELLVIADPSRRAWIKRLLDLGHAVSRRVRLVQSTGSDLAEVVGMQSGDTIYAIDRHVEPVIRDEIEAWSADLLPLIVIAEGMGDSGMLRFCGQEQGPVKFVVMIDPIDGSRNIMYDKRSAWFIATVAPYAGREVRLCDAIASVMVELPTQREVFSRRFFAGTNPGEIGMITHNELGITRQLPGIRPSTAITIRDGFAQVSNFFPGTKQLASELMERIVLRTLGGSVIPGSSLVFDDQYISSGGQMVELMLGHDRFCCDLRPLFYRIIKRATDTAVRGLECHPYDVGGLLIAQRAGVIITDGFGQPLNPIMSVDTPVHWCGYANQALQNRIEPVIQEWLQEKGIN
ncbi:MAG: hypothetical protein WC693_02410 [Patescibacteria group bacterium]|jgi:hypothetical protein